MKSVLVIQVAQSELSMQALRHSATLLPSSITSLTPLPLQSFGLHALHSRINCAGGLHE
jgi:hypothetical protein